ncbi:hypothetical protein [Jiella mangrovi]|uniref:Plasmid mobilization relaxosome protein MobC n=1 Tax=Jiella mangrovi TaxID=2821407 RepID=A0ABS4BBV4_9HYPH|nr:hypothetical protein [Jiella mangrovi]MBP0614230.1 hypothetical protein [Jiella mangrovi]
MKTKTRTKRGSVAAPISLRLTPEERAQLKIAAKGQSQSSYIRQRLFSGSDDANSPDLAFSAEQRLRPADRQRLLVQILANLGKAQIGASLVELSEAARLGVLPLTPDILTELRAACAHVTEIRSMLLRALGMGTGSTS